MKKIINQPENLVLEMCQGLISAHPDMLALDPAIKTIFRKEKAQNKVTLICGGGSGHEPAHAGFVGVGMLDAAVCGDVFASPSTIQVYKAICKSATPKGTLLIVKNYSGDCMNFDAAAEMAIEDDDIRVERVYVNDDVAVKDSLYTVGRRGVAGTLFVQKIAGAAAEMGWSLEEVKDVAQKAINQVRSIGFALTSCTVPAKGTPTFALAEHEMEFGVGIHGEPGIAREAVLTADEVASKMIDAILTDMPLEKDTPIAIMVNGLGATPLQELYVLNHAVSTQLREKGLALHKTFVGNYMTAIDMAGASLSILKLDDTLMPLLDAPCDTVALNVR